jgi:formamidopyrimidine-DNA glycosylase
MGMTGNFRAVEHKYARLKFEFRDHAPLYFIDKRNFGTVRLLHTSKIQHKLAQLGPDPLQKPIACDDHWYAIRHKWRDLTLAEFLMNQSVIAGIGNYLKCEILWEAGLSPHRFAGELSPMGMSRLLDAINRVPQVSFRNNGASIIDYATPDNLLGTFSRYFNVYGKKRDVNGDPVIKEKTKDGRSTYWSPMRQLYLPV